MITNYSRLAKVNWGICMEGESKDKKPETQKGIGEKVNFIISKKYFTLFLVIIGAIGFVFSQNLIDNLNSQAINTSTSTQVPQSVITTFYKIFLEIIKLLSGTCVSTGVLSLILRISSMKSDFKETVLDTYNKFAKEILVKNFNYKEAIEEKYKDILNSNFDLSNYDKSSLEVLHKKIIAQLLNNKSNNHKISYRDLDNSIYALESKIRDLSTGIFYEYHDMKTRILPDSKNKIFKKQIKSEFKVINNHRRENKIEYKFYFYKGTEPTLENFIITRFKINERTFEKEEIAEFLNLDQFDSEENSQFSHRITFYYPLHDCKEHIIYLDYEYILPITDLTHSYKLPYPSKKLNHNIAIAQELEQWELNVNGFSSWFHKGSDLKRELKVDQNTQTSAIIDFNYWTLPGAGYVVSYNRKVDLKPIRRT